MDEGPFTFEDAAAEYVKQAKKNLLQGGGIFFQSIRSICNPVLRVIGANEYCDRLELALGWSNLVKIGNKTGGNPEGGILTAQARLCIESLHEEILTMVPDATVLLTGSSYANKEIFYPVFGDDGWRNNVPEESQVALKEHKSLGPLLWVDHPRRWNINGITPQVINFVAGYLAGLISPARAR